jgi:protocatechuate 3,4-dioxygenase beta subunit
MLDGLEYDDSESPVIGLVPAGVPWEDIQDHIRIAHQPLVVFAEGGTDYAGVYWTGTAIAVVEDLGSDHDQAISEFRMSLRERGEA